MVDYSACRLRLEGIFDRVTSGSLPGLLEEDEKHDVCLSKIFSSNVQSYREVLLGCALMRLLDGSVNIRLPYVKLAANAYSGRTLDERVINPFLQEKAIPCSKGPFLAVFRRQVSLVPSTGEGLRDKQSFEAMLEYVSVIESASTPQELELLIACLIRRFISLRDASYVKLARIERMSIEHYNSLLNHLITHQSGGLLPVFIMVAFYQTLNEYYSQGWDISYQGINVADSATNQEGDITIRKGDTVLLAIEVTERPLDERRVTSTFNTKIQHGHALTYLFIYTHTAPDLAAYEKARSLYTLGYDVNFANASELVINSFLSQTQMARSLFMDKMITLLDDVSVSSAVKVAWNDSLRATIAI